ncbi:MAG: YraN family protein [Anaerovoracaceae bacterium]
MNNRELGEFGENVAVQYLENCGYTIVQRNYRCRAGEIDVIAGMHNRLSFIEVKTRRSSSTADPARLLQTARRSTSGQQPAAISVV